jgi:hypothetical protein
MNTSLFHRPHSEDLLEMLQACAHKLLLAYDETLQPDLWDAFEKTTQVCQTLAFDKTRYGSLTIH